MQRVLNLVEAALTSQGWSDPLPATYIFPKRRLPFISHYSILLLNHAAHENVKLWHRIVSAVLLGRAF